MLLNFVFVICYHIVLMKKRTEEWLKQSDYDMATAHYMHEGGRHIYAVGQEAIAWIKGQL